MRFFSFIFIFYLLFLSWQPCQDLQTKDSGRFTSIAESQHFQASREANTEETDDCSPFCVCSCCHVSTTYTQFNFSVSRRDLVFTRKYAASLYQRDYSQQYLDSIWQPPKFNFIA